MATTYERPGSFRIFIYALCIIASFFIFVFLTRAMFAGNPPKRINQGGREDRIRALQELKAANTTELNNFGVIDKNKGVYRLSVDRAMELVAQAKNPATIRAELTKRAEKASAPAPAPNYE
ncbi:MAG TPA: hypothetical protein VEH27_07130 [Methylomirabilota bacterium]|nr:hypothetical protein [Methylomirabilota bacterium]